MPRAAPRPRARPPRLADDGAPPRSLGFRAGLDIERVVRDADAARVDERVKAELGASAAAPPSEAALRRAGVRALTAGVAPGADRAGLTGVARRLLRGGCSTSVSFLLLLTTPSLLPLPLPRLLSSGVALLLLLRRPARSTAFAVFLPLFASSCCCFGLALAPLLPLLSPSPAEAAGALRFLADAPRRAGAGAEAATASDSRVLLPGTSAMSIERHKKFSRVEDTCLHLVQQISLAVAPRNSRSTWISTAAGPERAVDACAEADAGADADVDTDLRASFEAGADSVVADDAFALRPRRPVPRAKRWVMGGGVPGIVRLGLGKGGGGGGPALRTSACSSSTK